MPFKSAAQRKLFWWKSEHSKKWEKLAKEWQKETPKNKKLPTRVKSKKSS